jgi:hypothetical protein
MAHAVRPVFPRFASTDHTTPVFKIEQHFLKIRVWDQPMYGCRTLFAHKPRLQEYVIQKGLGLHFSIHGYTPLG